MHGSSSEDRDLFQGTQPQTPFYTTYILSSAKYWVHFALDILHPFNIASL
jgi:hypothetical protein